MSKFNVGDKVRVVKIIPNMWDGSTHEDMLGQVGTIAIINRIDPNDKHHKWPYLIDFLSEDQFGMLEDELELVKE